MKSITVLEDNNLATINFNKIIINEIIRHRDNFFFSYNALEDFLLLQLQLVLLSLTQRELQILRI